MNRLADLVHRGQPQRPHLAGVGIDLDLDDVAAPAVGAVGVAAIGRRRPTGSSPAARTAASPTSGPCCAEVLGRRQAAELLAHLLARSAAGSGRRPCRCARRPSGRCRARRRCRAARPRPARTACRARRRRSARASCACPGRSRCSTQHAHAGRGQLERRLRRELHLAAAGEAGAVEEQRQADAAIGARVRRALARGSSMRRTAVAQHLERAAVVAAAAGRWRWCRRAAARCARAAAPDRGRAPRRCAPCGLRRRTASAARRSRGTRRSAACWSSSRGRGCGRCRSGTDRRRECSRARAPPG